MRSQEPMALIRTSDTSGKGTRIQPQTVLMRHQSKSRQAVTESLRKEVRQMISGYEVTDALEVGEAQSLILDKETMNLDEVSGSVGPLSEALEIE